MRIHTPGSLIQGGTDSAHAFQNGRIEVFTYVVYDKALISIDDILPFDKIIE
jgi:hypothetical protein